MAETKLTVRDAAGYAALAAACAVVLFLAVDTFRNRDRGLQMTWHRTAIDGSRTGVVPVNAENVDTALGTFEDDTYVAPNGIRYAGGTVSEVASLLMEVQPGMARLKQVVGHSAKMMPNLRTEPETELSNMFVDALRARGSEYFGVPMDFAITNFGGIRCPLPEGAVTLDDIESMFPFKNYMVYAKMRGRELLRLFDQLALTQSFQAVSGARIRVKDHKIVSAEVGGRPVDPDRLYNVTTIDFLLSGGDRIAIGAMSEDVILTHVLLRDVMLDYVRAKEASGEVLDYQKDGRVVMED